MLVESRKQSQTVLSRKLDMGEERVRGKAIPVQRKRFSSATGGAHAVCLRERAPPVLAKALGPALQLGRNCLRTNHFRG